MQALPPPRRTALLYKLLVPYMQSQHGSFARNGVKSIGVKVGEWVLLTIMIMAVCEGGRENEVFVQIANMKSLLLAIHVVASKAFLNALLEATNDKSRTLERKIIGGHAVQGIEGHESGIHISGLWE